MMTSHAVAADRDNPDFLQRGSPEAKEKYCASLSGPLRKILMHRGQNAEVHEASGPNPIFMLWQSKEPYQSYRSEEALIVRGLAEARAVRPDLTRHLKVVVFTDATGYGCSCSGSDILVSVKELLTRLKNPRLPASESEKQDFCRGQLLHEAIHSARDLAFEEGGGLDSAVHTRIEVPAHIAEFSLTPLTNPLLEELVSPCVAAEEGSIGFRPIYTPAMRGALAVVGAALVKEDPTLKKFLKEGRSSGSIQGLLRLVREASPALLERVRPNLLDLALRIPAFPDSAEDSVRAVTSAAYRALELEPFPFG